MDEHRGLPLIGRERELAVLSQLLLKAQQGRPQVAMITGEAGSGKSTVVEAFLTEATRSATTLRGVCSEGATGGAFAPFADALRPLWRRGTANHSAVSSLRRLIDPAAGTDSGVNETRTRMFEAVLEFFADLDNVAVLMVDDLQWADPSSLELLSFLVRNLTNERLLILLASRDRAPTSVYEAVEDLRHAVHLTSLPLQPLDRSQLAHAFQAAWGHAPEPSDLETLHQLTGGNPFYVEEVLTSVSKSAPFGLRTLLLREAAALGPAARHVADILAVAGDPLPPRMVEVALGEDAASALTEVAASRVVMVSGTGLQLRHSLYRDALLDAMVPPQMRSLHSELAEIGERLAAEGVVGMGPAAVARHWLAAGDVRRAIPVLARAARQADAVFAFNEAYELWSSLLRCLDLLEEREHSHRTLRLEALTSAAAASRWRGDPRRSVDLITSALSITTTQERAVRARFHGQRAHFWRLCERLEEALTDIEVAASLLDTHDPSDLRAAVIAEHARLVMLGGDVKQAGELAASALTAAQDARDPALESRALCTLGVSQFDEGDLHAAVSSLRRARLLAATYGTVDDTIRAANNLCFALVSSGHRLAGLAAATEAIELARRAGIRHQGGPASVAEANAIAVLVELGRWPEAAQRLQLAIDEPGDIYHDRGWLLGTRAQLNASMGRFSEAEADLSTLDDLSLEEASTRSARAAATAELALWRHQPEEALRMATSALDTTGSAVDRGYLLSWCLRAIGDLTDLARLRGRDADRTNWGTQAAELLDKFGAGIAERGDYTAALIAAEMGRIAEGAVPELWQHAASQAGDQAYERAYALYREAQGRLVRGERNLASALLAQARLLAEELSARPLASAVEVYALQERLPLAAVSPPAKPDLGLREQLTQRENEVLGLLQQGLTNRKIGRMLGITERTAGVHVAHVLAKLGVANRTAAAAVARQLGL
ncbi:ATP-binding protein [Sinomonas sp. RB5]